MCGIAGIWQRDGQRIERATAERFIGALAHRGPDGERVLIEDDGSLALAHRRPGPGLIWHSDQGSQYTSEQFQRLLTDHGVICSMSKRGDCWDNAAMESFFASLKTERVARTVYRKREEAKADVFDYIERFYNPKRRHSTLGYVSPMQFEQRAKLA